MRTWVKALGGGFVAAMLIGSGQLGIAYSLGVLRWKEPFQAAAENSWNVHLTWVAFIAALAVVGGGLVGVRPLRRGDFAGLGASVAVALAALAGASVVVPLVALPAGSAVVPRAVDPALNVGIAAGLGVAVGFFAALAVLSARALAASVFVMAGWIWLLTLGSALASLNGPILPTGLRLGVLSLPQLPHPQAQSLVLPMMTGMAVLSGLIISGYARWLGDRPVTVAASGLAGPALVASAYLIAGPGISTDSGDQLVAWRAALVAAAAGFAVSALVAFVRPRRRRPGRGRRSADGISAGDPRPPAPEVVDEPVEMPVRPTPPVVPAPRRDEGRNEDYVDWVAGLRQE